MITKISQILNLQLNNNKIKIHNFYNKFYSKCPSVLWETDKQYKITNLELFPVYIKMNVKGTVLKRKWYFKKFFKFRYL